MIRKECEVTRVCGSFVDECMSSKDLLSTLCKRVVHTAYFAFTRLITLSEHDANPTQNLY